MQPIKEKRKLETFKTAETRVFPGTHFYMKPGSAEVIKQLKFKTRLKPIISGVLRRTDIISSQLLQTQLKLTLKSRIIRSNKKILKLGYIMKKYSGYPQM